MSCPTLEDLACGDVPAEHTRACPACADALRDLTAIRAEARRLGPHAWAAPPPDVDTEAALLAVLQTAPARPRRALGFLRLTSRAAAALLIAGLGAPYLLEARKARDPMPASLPPLKVSSVFWTSPTGLLTARK
jgi:hypothetical protein